jgi:hypothetical protein
MAMNHDFWLFRHGERTYDDYHDLLPRRDAPVSIDDEVLRYMLDTIQWIPTFNPALQKHHQGLNMWGTTIIEQAGGELVHQIFSAWAKLFASGPEQLQLTGLFTWQLPDDESDPQVSNDTRKDEDKLVIMEHDTEEDEIQVVALGTTGNYTQTTATGSYTQLKLDRDSFVQQLTTLAQFGKQAATGEFFIIHLGI